MAYPGGPERLEMLEVQSPQRGIRIKEGPPSVARRAWGKDPAEGVRSRKRKASNIDPVSGLPYTEDDYKRMDAEDQRKRQAKERREIFAHEAGVSVEELMVKNARLRKQLKEEIVKGRQSRTNRAVKEGRTKRMMNAEVELAVLAKSLKDKGAGAVTVYGLTHEDGNMTGESQIVHLTEVNSMLRRALDKYREEAKARQARVLEVEEEKSMILHKARLASPKGEIDEVRSGHREERGEEVI